MNMDLAIFWLDSTGKVIDKVLARRWKTIAAPNEGATYILETHPDLIDEYNIGDILEIMYE